MNCPAGNIRIYISRSPLRCMPSLIKTDISYNFASLLPAPLFLAVWVVNIDFNAWKYSNYILCTVCIYGHYVYRYAPSPSNANWATPLIRSCAHRCYHIVWSKREDRGLHIILKNLEFSPHSMKPLLSRIEGEVVCLSVCPADSPPLPPPTLL